MMRPGGGGLRGRLIALLLATLIPLVGLAGYWILREARHDREHAESQGREVAARVAAQVAYIVGEVQGMLSALAHVSAVQAQDRAESERLFREILARWPKLENVAAFTKEGTLFAAATPGASGTQILVQDRAWFQAAVQTGRPVAGDFLVSRLSGKPVAILAQPVLDGQGRVLGVVGAALDLAAVSREVAPVQLGISSVWAVVDGEGLVLLHGDPRGSIGKPLGPLQGMLHAEAVVRGTQWRAVVGIPHAVINASLRNTLISIGLPALLILLGATGAGFWIARNTWRPLQELATAVRRIGAGEREVRLPIEAPGEVSEVAAALRDALGAVAAREADLARRNKELAALVEASRAVVSSLDLEQSLQGIVRKAASIAGVPAVRLFLIHEDSQVLRWRVGIGLPPEAERDLAIPFGESFSGQVVATGKPLAVPDTRGDPRLRYPQHSTQHGLLSYLGLPVKVGDRVIGVLVFNTDAPRVYGEDEVALLSAFADQAAIAIENARLFQREQARRQQVEAVRAVSEEITRELDLTTLLTLIQRRAAELVGCSTGALHLWDEASQLLVPQAWHGYGAWRGEVRLRLGEGVAGTVAQRRQGMIVNDYRNSPYRLPVFLEHATTTAVLAEPLLYHERLLGVIVITNDDSERRFTEDDRYVLGLFAIQAATAIENARLYDAAVGRAQQLATLNELTRALTTELDPHSVPQAILTAVQTLIPDAACRLFERIEEGDTFRLVASIGLRQPDGGLRLRFHPGEGLVGAAVATRQPVISSDVSGDPRFVNKEWAAAEDLRSCIVLPLVFGDRVTGTLNILTRTSHDFTDEEVSLLQSFAGQAAIARENARLYGEALEKTERLEGLTRTSAKVAETLRLQEVLDAIVEEAAKLLRIEGAGFRLREGDRLVAASRYGLAHHTTLAPSLRIGESLGGLVAQQGRPLMVPDQREDPQILPEHRASAAAHGVVAYLGVPVRYRDRIIGVLHVDGKERRTFSEEEVRLLSAFADHAAIAIENARLYGEIQRYAATLEARVKERTAELEEALRVKVEFLGKMSHELRTPLNFVIGFSELLQQGIGGPLTTKQATYIDRVLRGGRQLLSLVNDVLDIAQVDAGKSRLHLEPVILGPLIQEILGLVQVQATQKRLKVTTALDPWLPFMVADRFKLAQILHNLVGNAVKFTPHGGRITLTARRVDWSSGQVVDWPQPIDQLTARPVDAPGEWVELAVEDTGIGIQAEKLESIFEAFYQVDSSETRAQGGAGLGLALVRKLVELHGGRVWAESPGPGQGTRFVVRIPRLEVSKAKRILLVEDEALIRIPMAAALESAGFAVVQAATGAEALANMEAVAPDLMILDILLPDMEGWEILRRVRDAEEVRTLPILVVSGLESVNLEKALARGADDYLTKPVSPRVLVDTAVRLLAQSGVGSAVAGSGGEGSGGALRV